MKAIILAAGLGSRLGVLTRDLPKCLAVINGRSILENALQILESEGFEECILVVGYKAERVWEKIGDKFGNMKITFVKNELYAKSNTSYSLWLAFHSIGSVATIYVLEGDVFFEQSLLKSFLRDKNANASIIDYYQPAYDGSFVVVNPAFKILDWVHKSRRPCGFTLTDKFKTVNIHKFSASFIQHYFLREQYNTYFLSNKSYPLEYVLQDIVKENEVDIFGFLSCEHKWFEIDTPEELVFANSIFKIV